MASDAGTAQPHLPFNVRTLLLVILVLVIGLVAALQYRWINQVSEAQEFRTKARLTEELRQISAALDTESTRAILAFTSPPPASQSMYEKLARTWANWNQEAPWPGILSGIAYFEESGDGWQRRSWGDPGAVGPRSLPAPLKSAGSSRPEFGSGPLMHIEAGNKDLVLDGQIYSLLPIPAPLEPLAEPRINWLVLHYDLGYVAGVVLPRLVARYSTAEDRSEFAFHIGFKGAAPQRRELVADGWHFRPGCLMPQGGGEPAIAMHAFRSSTQRGMAFGIRTAAQVNGQALSLTFLLHSPGQCQTLPGPSESGLLQISVMQGDSTLGDEFARFRRRNEVLSGVVLAILVAAMAALVVSTERTRRLARLETVLAAGLSHELRTPLASLGLAADDLKSGYVDGEEQARRYGEIIAAELGRLGHIVDQALALTGLNPSSRPSCLRPASLPDIVKTAVDAFAPRLSGAQIEVEMQFATHLPNILADPDLVLCSITNLLENAIKYASSGRRVLFSAHPVRHRRRAGVELIVEDRGPGIRHDEAAAVFEPFYRGSTARQCREAGSGLGLAIVKSAVLANGGRIKLESGVPQGCRFCLFFLADHSAEIAHPQAQGRE
jgi:signal transduction histidine kinase